LGKAKGERVNQEQIKNLVEIVGISAIVASLIFVGLELRQSQQIAIASQYQERSNTGIEYNYKVLETEWRLARRADRMQRRVDVVTAVASEPEKYWLENHTHIEWAREETWANISLYIFDNYHFQYESGFMTEEAWLSQRSRLRFVLATNLFARDNVVRDWWRMGFVEICLELIAENEQE
jgi:hypothetical protein